MQRDGTVREFEYQVRGARTTRCSGLGDSANAVPQRSRRVRTLWKAHVVTSPDQKRAEMRSRRTAVLQQVMRHVPAVIQMSRTEKLRSLDEPLHGRDFRVEPDRRDRQHHNRALSRATERQNDRREKTSAYWRRARGSDFYERNIWILRGICGNGGRTRAASRRRRRVIAQIRHRRARHR